MMICMEHHDTFPTLHPMIPIAFMLLHSIFLVTPSSSSHFTHCLHHQQQVIPQSSVPTPRVYPSHNHVRMFLVMVVSLIHSRNKFNTSPNIMHHTHVVVNFQSAATFNITIFSSFFSLDMDCIIRYHQCFPFQFTKPKLIPSYSICFLC